MPLNLETHARSFLISLSPPGETNAEGLCILSFSFFPLQLGNGEDIDFVNRFNGFPMSPLHWPPK